MSIGRDEVRHVARLAELAVPEEELDNLVRQLNRIVDYVAALDRLPADRGPIAFRGNDSGWAEQIGNIARHVEA